MTSYCAVTQDLNEHEYQQSSIVDDQLKDIKLKEVIAEYDLRSVVESDDDAIEDSFNPAVNLQGKQAGADYLRGALRLYKAGYRDLAADKLFMPALEYLEFLVIEEAERRLDIQERDNMLAGGL